MKIGKKIVESNVFKTVVAFVAALFIKLVRRTSSFEIHRYDILQRYWAAGEPIICATWHGQNTLLPTFWHNWRELRVLVSLHGDGEIIARFLHFLGVGTIRGSGVPKGQEKLEKSKRKGGATAMRAMLRALNEDISIALTADMPPGPARKAVDGIVMLACLSGRPIVPVALATRARIQLNNWDRFTIHLPFTRGALVLGDPIFVPRDADAAALERARQAVEDSLNAASDDAARRVGLQPAAAAISQHS